MKTQAELKEESRNEQAKKYMKPNSELQDNEKLSNHSIDVRGDQITNKVQGVENGCPVDSTQAMVVPYTITLGTHDKIQNEQLDLAERMQSLPTHINGIGDTIIPQNVDPAMKSNPTHVNVVSNIIPLDHPLSLLEIYTTTKSTDTGADTAAKMVVPDRISAWY